MRRSQDCYLSFKKKWDTEPGCKALEGPTLVRFLAPLGLGTPCSAKDRHTTVRIDVKLELNH